MRSSDRAGPPSSLPDGTPLLRGSVPLHRQLSQVLRAAIAEGRFALGQTLPTENALSAKYAVSRITVRHALANLEREGLVRRNRPTGNVVASDWPALTNAWSFESLQDIVAFGEQTRVRILSFDQQKATDDVTALFGTTAGVALPCVHGLRLMNELPLSEFFFWIAPTVASQLTSEDLHKPTLFSVIENRLGVRLVQAEQTVWCEPAGRALARLLKMSAAAPVLAIRRVYLAENKVPVEIAISRFNGARYQLHHILNRISTGVVEML